MRLEGTQPTPTPVPSQTPSSQVIQFNSDASGELNDAQSYRSFEFDASADDVITIRVYATSGDLDPMLKLWDDAGSEIANDDDSGFGISALIEDFVIPRDGRYIAQAHRKPDTSGSYQLELKRQPPTPTPTPSPTDEPTATPTPVAELLFSGDSVRGYVADRTEDRWTFDAAEGDRLTILMRRTSGSYAPRIRLLNANGALIVDDEGLDTASLSSYYAPHTGSYTVSAGRVADGSGDYTLQFVKRSDAPPPNANLTHGSSITAERAFGDEVHQYRFNATAGGSISIVMETVGGNLLPKLYLLDSGGSEGLAQDRNDSGNPSARIQNFIAPYSGEYVIFAMDNCCGRGTYRLSLEALAPTPTKAVAAITNGQTVTGSVGEGPWENWVFSADEGQLISIAMERASGDLMPAIYLLNNQRHKIAEDPNLGGGASASVVDFVAPYRGAYVINAGRYCCGTGAYTLRLDLRTPAPPPPAKPNHRPNHPRANGHGQYDRRAMGPLALQRERRRRNLAAHGAQRRRLAAAHLLALPGRRLAGRSRTPLQPRQFAHR